MKLWTRRLGITLTVIFIFSPAAQASFIEATIGTAVVNDATATYHNPAALTRLEGSQMVGLGTVAYYHSQFSGNASQPSGQTQFGIANTKARYYLPSFYYAMPVTGKVVMALGVVSNFFNTNPDENSIIRYVEAGNDIQDINIIPALGVKLNEYFALGAAINLAHARMMMQPISGFPALNIADSESHNTASGNGVGADVGVLLKPAYATLIGFNYQSAVAYHFKGKSMLANNPDIFSNDYHFKF